MVEMKWKCKEQQQYDRTRGKSRRPVTQQEELR